MLLLAFALALASDPPSFDSYCSDPRNCRQVGNVDIRVGEQTMTGQLNQRLPFVTEEGLTLFVGESVVVSLGGEGEVVVESNRPASEVVNEARLRQAAEEVQAAGQIALNGAVPSRISSTEDSVASDRLRLSFAQVPGTDHAVLLVENGYGDRIDYRVTMQMPDGRGPQPTTACQVLPNLSSLEHWPHPIFVLTLSDFRIVDNGGALVCD